MSGRIISWQCHLSNVSLEEPGTDSKSRQGSDWRGHKK